VTRYPVGMSKFFLAVSHPELAAQAHGWDPKNVATNTHKKMDWLCPSGHVYSASVASRTSKQSGCPFCTNQKTLPGFNDIATTHPEIAKEAFGWDPTEYVAGSQRTLEWKCSLGHVFSMKPTSRTAQNQGCPFCGKQRLLKGFNDLATTNPDIAKEADGWDPSELISAGTKKMNWRCANGHSYSKTISSRKSGSGCAVCANKQTLPGFNDLATTHPEIALEAFGWDPKQLTYGSNKQVKWKCPEGHVWTTAPKNRTVEKLNCTVCSRRRLISGERIRKVIPSINDLATLHPEIAKMAHGWDPTTVKASDKTVRSWMCKEGHVSEVQVVTKVYRGQACQFCSGRKSIKGETDLATTHPSLAREADGWDPTQYSKGARDKMGWKCAKGHKWTAIISSRAVAGRGCPFCSGRYVIPGETDIQTLYPELAAQAVGWDPSKIHFGSPKKLLWRCELGHEWIAAAAHRTRKQTGCPYCGNDIPLAGFNDIGTTHPEIAKQAFEWDPTTVVAGSHKVRKWRCELGHVYSTPIFQRALLGGACFYCSGHKTLPGFNDLATTNPELLDQVDGWDPTQFVQNSHRIVAWKCELGHQWTARIFSRASNGLGCPICSGFKVLPGFNDLATTHPELAAQAVGWDTTTVSRGTQVKKKWRCEFGHEWIAYVHSRSQGFGCPSCSVSGFDPNKDGWLYFLSHPHWEMLQIGITNVPDDRLGSHRKLGWELLELRGPMDGHLTAQWETAILRMLKASGADLSNSSIAGKFDGYSEAWSSAKLSFSSIKDLMKKTEEYEASLPPIKGSGPK